MHPSRNCWQHEYAEKSDSPLAQEFKENFDDYVKPEDDYRGYKNQIVERDAREYANDITDAINSNDDLVTPDDKEDTIGNNRTSQEIRENSEEKGNTFDNVETKLPEDLESKVEHESKLKDISFYKNQFEYENQQKLETLYQKHNGQLSGEDRIHLVEEFKKDYDQCADTGDVTVPESPKDVKGIAYNKYTQKYEVIYGWDKNDTMVDTREMRVLKEGEQFDRVGPPTGRCVGEVDSEGNCATREQRSLPYHLTKGNIIDEPSYHRYEALHDFTRENIENQIENSYSLSEEQKATYKSLVADYYDKVEKKYGSGDGLAYGEISPMFRNTTESTGHGHQYDMPLNMDQLYEIGMIDIVDRKDY